MNFASGASEDGQMYFHNSLTIVRVCVFLNSLPSWLSPLLPDSLGPWAVAGGGPHLHTTRVGGGAGSVK